MAYGNPKLIARAMRRDRFARYFITVGGVAIIAAVVAILLLILGVALPLFGRTSVTLEPHAVATGSAVDDVLAVGLDDYATIAYAVTRAGEAVFYNTADGTERERIDLGGGGTQLAEVQTWGNINHALIWVDGRVTFANVALRPVFDSVGQRSIEHKLEILNEVPAPEAGRSARTVARRDSTGGIARVDLFEDGRMRVAKAEVSRDLFGNESIEASEGFASVPDGAVITALTLDQAARFLYAGTESGHLLRWDVRDIDAIALLDDVPAIRAGAVTALGFVFGDTSLAVGGAGGSLSTWFPVTPEGGTPRLTRVHDLGRQTGAVISIVPSRRNKSIAALDANGLGSLEYMTSERRLGKFSADQRLLHLALSEKGEAAVALDQSGRLRFFEIHAPHPEISLRTLFGKVFYETYSQPEYVWQSSSGNDDYESKMSLTPLVFGSFKGTVYAMFFAVPLALLGAIYTSQFLAPEVRSVIKPVVEVMASIPSVVIGFLVALWLAPVIERLLVPFFLSLIIMPLMFVPFMLLYMNLAGSPLARRIERGYEFVLTLPFLLAGALLAVVLGPPVENLLFDGNFQIWLFESTGQRYDQRNAIIIAFGLGFAAIPIIFTIAEDALSNIPHGLRAASLALGASRWQTVWRVMLPSASPGIFAAVIIGFGRVIGETMIVLMATGNTPIMDWSPFNGMRTLSANIAVEIPEAPIGGTLYRVLFLSAALLFTLTFILNTAAELIRQRLRKKYGQFQ